MWLVFGLVWVLLLKAYTSRVIGKLQVRMYVARKALRETREKHQAAARRRAAMKTQRQQLEFRVQGTKEIIRELTARLEGTQIDGFSETQAASQKNVTTDV